MNALTLRANLCQLLSPVAHVAGTAPHKWKKKKLEMPFSMTNPVISETEKAGGEFGRSNVILPN